MSASGTLTVTPDGVNQYLITGISGTRNGNAILSLSAPFTDLGDGSQGDNQIFFAPPAPTSTASFTPVDGSNSAYISGFGFTTSDGTFQPYTFTGGNYGSYGPFAAGEYQYVIGTYANPPGTFVNTAIDFTVSASAPDGGTTLALLGLAIAGLAGLRRKLSL